VPYGCGTRNVSIAVARPSASQSTTDALDPDAALRRAKPDRHARAHPPDRELGLDADHGIVRAGHAASVIAAVPPGWTRASLV
jgi:hypothetical protein